MKKIIKIVLFLQCINFFISCNNSGKTIPLPADSAASPVTIPLHFSKEKQIKFSDTTFIQSVTKPLNFNALPDEIVDSSGFKPFAQAPSVTSFNLDSVPDTVFNYNKLPSKPLKFETSILPAPQLLKANLHLRNSSGFPVYQFNELLQDDRITCLYEDHNGFIWIATTNDVYRYDGNSLWLYVRKPKIQVFSMVEDKHGQIWMATSGNNGGPGDGLYILDIKHNVLKRLSASSGLSTASTYRIVLAKDGKLWCTGGEVVHIIDEDASIVKSVGNSGGLKGSNLFGLFQDRDENIWVSSFSGNVNVVDIKHGRIKHVDNNLRLDDNALTAYTQDKEGRIWASNFTGEIICIDAQKKIVTHYFTKQGLKPTAPFTILYNKSDGNIWIGTTFIGGNNGIEIINPQKQSLKTIVANNVLSNDGIECLIQDNRNQVWVATETGINIINNNIEHLGNMDITALAEDNHKNIWIATLYNGIQIFNPTTGRVKLLNTANGLSSDSLNDVKVKQGKIFISTRAGLDIIDSNYQSITHVTNNEWAQTQLSVCFIDKQNKLWFINFRLTGAEVIDFKNNLCYHSNITDSFVNDLKQDKQGNIWFTAIHGQTGIYNGNSTVKYLTDSIFLQTDFGNYQLLCDEEDNVWVNEDILCKINKSRDSATLLTSKQGLFSGGIVSLNEYHGKIFAGTKQGINIITQPSSSPDENWHVQSYGKDYGINKLVSSQQSDAITSDGTFLWGDKGITFLSPALLSQPAFPQTYFNGIDIFNQQQYFANKPGNRIVQEDTLWNEDKSKFYVKGESINTAFNAAQNKMNWDSTAGAYDMPVNLKLPYDENNITFHFTQSNSGLTNTVLYRYILQGSDKQWSEKTTNTFSNTYFNLPGGKYIFKVSSFYNNAWAKPSEFGFTIASPWWKRWWAYLLYAFVIVLLYATLRAINLNRQNKLLETKVNERTEQLNQSLQELKSTQSQLIQSEKMASLGELTAGIAHEIQNPLNFVNNFSEINNELIEELKAESSMMNAEQKELMNDIYANNEKIALHGKRADAIVKGMLQHSRKNTGQKEPADINKLCDEYLRLSYHGLRAKDKNFNADFKTDLDESIDKINIVAQDISRVFLNLFNNAFYAVNEKSHQLSNGDYRPIVSVQTKKINNAVEIKISDNGNGIPSNIIDKIFQPFFTTKPTGQGTGLGLSLAYDIITKEHNGSLKVESKEGEGSRFVIQLPFE